LPDAPDKVQALIGDLPSGSYCVLAHLAGDICADAFAVAGKQQAELARAGRLRPMSVRNREEVAQYVAGLELLEPGLVSVDHWRPDDAVPSLPGNLTTPVYGVVGRKP
jgi:hypothetical protein